MSAAHLLLDNFNAGELSPLVGSRFQVEKVANGCRKLRNFIPHPHGPVFRRPGMERMGAAATDATAPNLRSFQFSGSTVFVLELTTVGLRVWQNGALVTLLAPVPLPYSAAELPAVQMAQVNDVVYLTHPNHEPRRLVRWANNDWRLGVVPWKWPALGDENPGSQALPDQYDVASSYGVTAYQVKTLDFTVSAELTGIGFSAGYNVDGPHHVQLLREVQSPNVFTGYQNAYDVLWNASNAPASSITGPFGTGIGNGLGLTNNYRLIYQGPGWPSGIVRILWLNGAELVSIDLIVNPAAMQPAPPPAFTVQPGKYHVAVNATGLNANGLGTTRLQLQSRLTPGTGAWSVVNDFASSPVAYSFSGLLSAVTEFRWVYTGMSNLGGGALAKFEAISLSAPYQTSIECSAATVGTGRTLTANRSVFLPGHVGAFWQLTHRRENAFVELAPTSAAVAATGTLTLSGVAANNQTVTIGSRTYTLKTTLTTSATANEVLIGANATATRDNLIAAINAGAGAGTTYGSQTAPHADVTAAAAPSGTAVVVTARKPGTGAHSVTLTETMSNASWNDVFLSGGVGANTTIAAASTAGLRINGRWEVTTYGSWESTLYLERLTASGGWEFVRSWRSNKDRNVAVQGETDGDETLRLRIVAGTASETSTEAAPRFVLEAADARVDGLVKITAVASAVSATCEVISPLLDTSPTYVWTEGAWSTARGFPRVVTMHENRLWFGGTAAEPLRVWASVTGDIENFRRSSLDDASLSFTPTAGELNPIQWLASQGKELVMGTLGDEWTITGEGQPITPTNVKFERQSAHGSAQVQAVMAGEVIAFVQRGGRKVRRISARSDADAWATSDMTVLAEHVTAGGIRQMAYGSHPNAILWAVTGDGKLLGLTLEVEQNVFGWHVHETDGLVESVAVVYGADADEVWVSVLRGTARSIERLDPRVFSRRFEEFDRMIYADAAKVIDLAPASATVGGLAHLNGKTVCVLADGVEHPTRVVSGGSITLQAPASRVVVGLPFTSELQPSKREVQTDKGSAQGRLWRVSRVGVFVHDSRGGQVADSPASRFERLPFPAGSALYSGDLETAIESNARHNIEATVKTSAPLPLNVGAVVLKLDLYGD
jgi:hypothetical protein